MATASELSADGIDDAASPMTPILFFDGVCGLCNSSVDHLLKIDRAGRLRFAPLQGQTAREYVTPDDIERLKSLVFVDEAGVHRRSTAVVRILRTLGGRHRLYAALLWLIPLPLRDFGYRIVSRLRYRLFGKKETCRLPSAEERSRFLP